MRDVFAYRLRVLEAVTADAAMPLVACEDVWTPLGALRVVFGIGHLQILWRVTRAAPEGYTVSIGNTSAVVSRRRGGVAARGAGAASAAAGRRLRRCLWIF